MILNDDDFQRLLGQTPGAWAASGWDVERISQDLRARGHDATVDLIDACAAVLEGAGLPQRPAAAFQVGQAVTWLYVPPGGYGFVFPVDGIVVKIGSKRVQVEVSKSTGERVRRWVEPDNLKARG